MSANNFSEKQTTWVSSVAIVMVHVMSLIAIPFGILVGFFHGSSFYDHSYSNSPDPFLDTIFTVQYMINLLVAPILVIIGAVLGVIAKIKHKRNMTRIALLVAVLVIINSLLMLAVSEVSKPPSVF